MGDRIHNRMSPSILGGQALVKPAWSDAYSDPHQRESSEILWGSIGN